MVRAVAPGVGVCVAGVAVWPGWWGVLAGAWFRLAAVHLRPLDPMLFRATSRSSERTLSRSRGQNSLNPLWRRAHSTFGSDLSFIATCISI